MLPVIAGTLIAEEALKEALLSRVASLVLDKPLPDLAGFPTGEPEENDLTDKYKLGALSLDRVRTTNAYVYTIPRDRPIYLIAALGDAVALYLPPPAARLDDGRLILVSREIIRSLQLASRVMDLHQQPVITLSEEAAGTTIAVDQEQVLAVRLPGCPADGYVWQAVEFDRRHLEQVNRDGRVISEGDDRLITDLRFRALAPGKTKLRRKREQYKRRWPWDRQSRSYEQDFALAIEIHEAQRQSRPRRKETRRPNTSLF